MENNVVLDVKNVTKIYGLDTENEFEALHNITFQAKLGDFICVMGPSGSGKSTFINNISTIDIPNKGFVYINGEEVRTMTESQIGKFRYENLGFIFQDFNLLSSHTLLENIALPLTLAKVPTKEIKERVEKIAKEFQIEGLLKKYPSECSGGQRQRAAICRALVNNPKIVVADEPTGNLDSNNSHQLLTMLKKMNDEGVTIIMVTHDPLIASYSKQLLYIKDGNIEDTIQRGKDDQDTYFQRIVDLNSKESRMLFNHD
ncbi:MAG: ABC transporter ATP-binding protein [Thomasclavelia sp.]|nr:ABC transporter ATP-binding protein [Thomasclavelia sp.]